MTSVSSRGSHLGLRASFHFPVYLLEPTGAWSCLAHTGLCELKVLRRESVCANCSLGLPHQVYFLLFCYTEGRGDSSLHPSCSEMGDGKRRVSWMLRSRSVSPGDSERQRQLAGRRLLTPESCPLAPHAHFHVLTHHTHC